MKSHVFQAEQEMWAGVPRPCDEIHECEIFRRLILERRRGLASQPGELREDARMRINDKTGERERDAVRDAIGLFRKARNETD